MVLEELTQDELAALERYRKERDSDSEYTPWISEGITEADYFKRLYLEMSNELAALLAFTNKLASTPCENFTAGWDCKYDGRTATAEDYADRMCVPCQARDALNNHHPAPKQLSTPDPQ